MAQKFAKVAKPGRVELADGGKPESALQVLALTVRDAAILSDRAKCPREGYDGRESIMIIGVFFWLGLINNFRI